MSQDVEKGLIGIELSQLPQNGSTKSPLHEAVEKSDLTTICKLIQTENINMKDSDGNTALHIAIKRGNIYIIQVVLSSGINVEINATNKKGQTPLHLALDKSYQSKESSKQIISILLSRKEIDLDSAKYNGESCRDILEKKWFVMYMFYMMYQRKTEEFIVLAKTYYYILEEDDGYRTFLQYACYKDLKDIVAALLDLKVNPIRKSNVPPFTIYEKMAESPYVKDLLWRFVNEIRDSQEPPLRIASRKKYGSEILRMLLMNPRIGGDTNKKGNTALHIAMKLQADRFGLTEDEKISIIRILCNNNKDINAINKKGQTPLDLAIAEGNEDISIRSFRYWDVATRKYKNQSSREILEQRYPKIVLYQYMVRGKTRDFINLAKKINREVLEEEICGSTLLKLACEQGSKEIVKILLSKGVDLEENFSDNVNSPLSIAIRHFYYEILQMLLEYTNLNKIPPNSLSWLSESNLEHYNENVFHPQAKINGMKCLKLLWPRIDYDTDYIKLYVRKNVNSIFKFFQYSTNADDSCILELLKLHPFIGGINERGNHAFMYLRPLLLEKYLDECIFIDNSKSIKEIEFNYKSFASPEYLNSSIKSQINKNQSNALLETGLFLKMGSLPEFRQLLKHPVIASFLNLKWLAMRKFFYINVIFYFIFCVLLTVYVSSKYVSWSSIDSSRNSNVTTPNMTESFKSDSVYVIKLHKVTVLFWVIFSLRELVQLWISPSWYIKSPENLLEIVIVLTGGNVLLFQTTSVHYELLILFTLSLSSWGEAVLLIGRHPKLSIYITIFKRVIWNFLAFLLLYGILIVAFALGFCFLFSRETMQNGNNPFENPLVAFFKIFIMMTGEFNSSDFQFKEFPILGRAIFIIFVFLIAIVLSSLLNGLAVGDIQTIRSDAELLEIMYRIEMFQYYESMPVLNMLSNMFDSLTKLRWLNIWIRRKCYTLKSWFSVALFPNVIHHYKLYVCPQFYNAVSFQPENSLLHRNFQSSYFKRFFMWRINSDIVKAAKKLNEKKIQNNETSTMEDFVRRCSEQLKLHEYMLKENLNAVHDVVKSNEKKFDKLLQTVARISDLVYDHVPCSRH